MNACCLRVPGVACAGAEYCRYGPGLAVADDEAADVGAAVALGVAAALGVATAAGAVGVAGGRVVGATAPGLAPGTAATPDEALDEPPDEALAAGGPATAEVPGITAECPRSSSACVPDPDAVPVLG
jgi:hypothetical protein